MIICGQDKTIYKFLPQKGEFTRCCDAKQVKFNYKEFDIRGYDYIRNSTHLKQRSEDLDKGIKHQDCIACWWKEDNNIKSMRQVFDHVHKNKKYLRPGKEREKINAQRIEIWPSNLCNLGCFMCNPGDSSIVQKIKKIPNNHIARDSYTEHRKKQFTEYMLRFVKEAIEEKNEVGHLTIAFLGGEPTLHSEIYDWATKFFNFSKDVDHKTFEISIVTNGTAKPKLMERINKMFREAHNVNWKTSVMLSYDGVDKQSNVRFLSEKYAELIQENLKSYYTSKDIDSVVTFSVLSNINLPYINNLIKKQYEMLSSIDIYGEIRINYNTLDHPEWMKQIYLPKKYAEKSIEESFFYLKKIEEITDKQNKLKNSHYYYNSSIQYTVFNSVVENLKNDVDKKDIEFFFKKLQENQQQYREFYPEFNFEDYFPHLIDLAEEYQMEHYLI